jgi:hypothetical protein
MIKQITILLLLAFSVFGATYYVSPNGSHTSPFDTLEKASTNIAETINNILDGDTVIIDEGDYYLTNNISIDTSMNNISILGATENRESFRINLQSNRFVTSENSSGPTNVLIANLTFQNYNNSEVTDNQRMITIPAGSVFSNILVRYNISKAVNTDIDPAVNNAHIVSVGGLTYQRNTTIKNVKIHDNQIIRHGRSSFLFSSMHSNSIIDTVEISNNIYTNINVERNSFGARFFYTFYPQNGNIFKNFIIQSNKSYSAYGDSFMNIALNSTYLNNQTGVLFENFTLRGNVFDAQNTPEGQPVGVGNAGSLIGFWGGNSVGTDSKIVFKNFIIYDNDLFDFGSQGAIFITGPTLRNAIFERWLVYNNNITIGSNKDMFYFDGTGISVMKNSTFFQIGSFLFRNGSQIEFKNSIFRNSFGGTLTTITNIYCAFRDVLSDASLPGESLGDGSIKTDLNNVFIDPDNFDFTIKSEAGGWDEQLGTWVYSDSTSPTVDGGDPTDDASGEPYYNGNIINMGYYGGTPKAAKSLGATFHGITELTNQPVKVVIPDYF